MSDNIQYARKIFFLLGENKNKIPWLVFLFICSSLLDLLGLGLIFSYISLIIDKDVFIQSEFYLLISQVNFIFLELDELYVVLELFF